MDKIINFRRFVSDEVDTPAAERVSDDQMREVGGRETHPVSEYEVLKLIKEFANWCLWTNEDNLLPRWGACL